MFLGFNVNANELIPKKKKIIIHLKMTIVFNSVSETYSIVNNGDYYGLNFNDLKMSWNAQEINIYIYVYTFK